MTAKARQIKPSIKPSLKDSERRYRRLFEAAQDGILILDAKTGAIDDVNPYLIDMLGYTREEMLDKKLWEVGAFKDVEASQDAFEKLQKTDYVRYHDLPLKSKDGRLIQVEFVSNVYQVDHKAVIQCNIRNTTEGMEAQKALRDSESRFRALFAGMTDVVIVYDAEGRYLEIAPTNPINLARPASEMLGRTVSEFFPPDEAGFLLEHIRQVLKNGQPANVEYSLRLGGQLRWFSAAVSPLSSGSVIWVAHDVTERKRAEEALKRSETRFRIVCRERPATTSHFWRPTALWCGKVLPWYGAWATRRTCCVASQHAGSCRTPDGFGADPEPAGRAIRAAAAKPVSRYVPNATQQRLLALVRGCRARTCWTNSPAEPIVINSSATSPSASRRRPHCARARNDPANWLKRVLRELRFTTMARFWKRISLSLIYLDMSFENCLG